MSIRGKAAIIGYGETNFEKRNSGNRSNYTEYCRAVKLAIEDAGLTKDDIDGLISIYPLDEEPTWTEDLQEYLQLHRNFLIMFIAGVLREMRRFCMRQPSLLAESVTMS